MRIETKFNVGDTVFAAEHDRLNRPLVLKLTIKSIQVFFNFIFSHSRFFNLSTMILIM